ncbi:MAG: hypothetical protein ABJM29_17405 [Rhizobiaceae bacterium]
MDDHTLDSMHEENHAFWWTIDGMALGQCRSKNPDYYWTIQPEESWCSLHKVRSTPEVFDQVLGDLISQAQVIDGAIHAHISSRSEPDNCIALMRNRGFQHAVRYPVLAESLSRLTSSGQKTDIRSDLITDFTQFGASFSHPQLGKIKTKSQKNLLTQLQSRVENSNGNIEHYLLQNDDQILGAFTLVFYAETCGLYDIKFLDEFYDSEHFEALTDEVIRLAKRRESLAVAMIKDRNETTFFRSRGFREVGWLSWLYLSKSKVHAAAI